jgi:hypothetical protein
MDKRCYPWRENYTIKYGTCKKFRFLLKHPFLAYLVFDKNYKKAGTELKILAQRELGYSERTYFGDYRRGLADCWEQIKAERNKEIICPDS